MVAPVGVHDGSSRCFEKVLVGGDCCWDTLKLPRSTRIRYYSKLGGNLNLRLFQHSIVWFLLIWGCPYFGTHSYNRPMMLMGHSHGEAPITLDDTPMIPIVVDPPILLALNHHKQKKTCCEVSPSVESAAWTAAAVASSCGFGKLIQIGLSHSMQWFITIFSICWKKWNK